MIPAATQQLLNELAHKYGNELINNVRNVLSQPAYRNSGELADSLKLIITPATDTEAPTIVLTYADQGFFIGYKNPQWTKLPNIEKLKKWAETKITSLGDIPGYEYGTASSLSVEKQRERIVWAIAKDKRKEDTWKPKKWKNAARLGDILSMINKDTIEVWRKQVEEVLANSITTGQELS